MSRTVLGEGGTRRKRIYFLPLRALQPGDEVLTNTFSNVTDRHKNSSMVHCGNKEDMCITLTKEQ